MDGTVLLADDDRTIRTVLTQALTRAGCKVRATGSAGTLWRWIEEGAGNVVVSDVMMPDGDGLDLLPAILRKRPDLPVIVISAQNTVMTAIRASDSGAYDYLPKPFDLRVFLSKVSQALSQTLPSMPSNPSNKEVPADLPMVGSSSAMQEVYRIFARVLNTDLNVMISGESGTGKNLVARNLHDLSIRKSAPFITIDCTNTTPGEISAVFSEYNTPEDQRATLYLDNVGDLSAGSQGFLLKAIQSEEKPLCDFRILSSTRRKLGPQVNEGLFRADLFYRLNVIPISMPSLRDRLEDIPELVNHFLHGQMAQKSISKPAMDLFRRVAWLGNIRELENIVVRLALLTSEDEITAASVTLALDQSDELQFEEKQVSGDKLSSTVQRHIKRYFDLHGNNLPPPGLYNRILREIELPLIALSLSATRGNQIKTAELLGINRNTLRKKIKELDIQVTRTRKVT